MYYVDESGSIPSFKPSHPKNRHFLIAFIHTDNQKALEKVHRRSLKNVKKYFPHLFDHNNELKASLAPPFIKEYLISRIINKTDTKFGYMLVDNFKIKEQFRKYKSRSFNYLLKLVMTSHNYGACCTDSLILNIDNRNSKITNLDSLEDHLYEELVLKHELTDEVTVNYLESHNEINVQVADLIANTVFQYYKYRNYRFRYELIDPSNCTRCPDSYIHLYQLIKENFFFVQEFPGGRSKNPIAI
ncbi:DUF3800 domain-containing protein [Terribacillus saccharophilus]|uniref:DUF3800 domain-containing protein n=1 Tax=Terribacillus saccharophilus TaxID=361277 RepID=A0ABX4H0S1_9BACI|nr:DUF3800 domain-containing protein [Terribacillus saccharophilus]PAD36318.1 hypothetical protein CHH56_04815 [Terribacillus saccharophilus]PAD95040.1 hypothetical protein CHH50_15670 [Terribacillus saccharophilus]PAE00737.1 hypothetical protein CHH48_05520 [Terribacillus saccharophilus]